MSSFIFTLLSKLIFLSLYFILFIQVTIILIHLLIFLLKHRYIFEYKTKGILHFEYFSIRNYNINLLLKEIYLSFGLFYIKIHIGDVVFNKKINFFSASNENNSKSQSKSMNLTYEDIFKEEILEKNKENMKKIEDFRKNYIFFYILYYIILLFRIEIERIGVDFKVKSSNDDSKEAKENQLNVINLSIIIYKFSLRRLIFSVNEVFSYFFEEKNKNFHEILNINQVNFTFNSNQSLYQSENNDFNLNLNEFFRFLGLNLNSINLQVNKAELSYKSIFFQKIESFLDAFQSKILEKTRNFNEEDYIIRLLNEIKDDFFNEIDLNIRIFILKHENFLLKSDFQVKFKSKSKKNKEKQGNQLEIDVKQSKILINSKKILLYSKDNRLLNVTNLKIEQNENLKLDYVKNEINLVETVKITVPIDDLHIESTEINDLIYFINEILHQIHMKKYYSFKTIHAYQNDVSVDVYINSFRLYDYSGYISTSQLNIRIDCKFYDQIKIEKVKIQIQTANPLIVTNKTTESIFSFFLIQQVEITLIEDYETSQIKVIIPFVKAETHESNLLLFIRILSKSLEFYLKKSAFHTFLKVLLGFEGNFTCPTKFKKTIFERISVEIKRIELIHLLDFDLKRRYILMISQFKIRVDEDLTIENISIYDNSYKKIMFSDEINVKVSPNLNLTTIRRIVVDVVSIKDLFNIVALVNNIIYLIKYVIYHNDEKFLGVYSPFIEFYSSEMEKNGLIRKIEKINKIEVFSLEIVNSRYTFFTYVPNNQKESLDDIGNSFGFNHERQKSFFLKKHLILKESLFLKIENKITFSYVNQSTILSFNDFKKEAIKEITDLHKENQANLSQILKKHSKKCEYTKKNIDFNVEIYITKCFIVNITPSQAYEYIHIGDFHIYFNKNEQQGSQIITKTEKTENENINSFVLQSSGCIVSSGLHKTHQVKSKIKLNFSLLFIKMTVQTLSSLLKMINQGVELYKNYEDQVKIVELKNEFYEETIFELNLNEFSFSLKEKNEIFNGKPMSYCLILNTKRIQLDLLLKNEIESVGVCIESLVFSKEDHFFLDFTCVNRKNVSEERCFYGNCLFSKENQLENNEFSFITIPIFEVTYERNERKINVFLPFRLVKKQDFSSSFSKKENKKKENTSLSEKDSFKDNVFQSKDDLNLKSTLKEYVKNTNSVLIYVNLEYIDELLKLFIVFKSIFNEKHRKQSICLSKNQESSIFINILIYNFKLIYDFDKTLKSKTKKFLSKSFLFPAKGLNVYLIKVYEIYFKSHKAELSGTELSLTKISNEKTLVNDNDYEWKTCRSNEIIISEIGKFNKFFGLPYENEKMKINQTEIDYFFIFSDNKSSHFSQDMKKTKENNENNEKNEMTSSTTFLKITSFYINLKNKSTQSTREMFQLHFVEKENDNYNKNYVIEIKNPNLIWNKFSKDVIESIFIGEILSIQRKLHEINGNNENSEKNERNLRKKELIFKEDFEKNESFSNRNDLFKSRNSRNALTMIKFELINPQIILQNEIKMLSMLLYVKKNIKLYISSHNSIKGLYSRHSLFTDLVINNASLYMSPFSSFNKVYFIGDSSSSPHYIEENYFVEIINISSTKIFIEETIANLISDCIDDIVNESIKTKIGIAIDEVDGSLEGSHYHSIMNILDVMIFDRGYSLQEQKYSVENIVNDLERKGKELIFKEIKSMTVQKKDFVVKEIVFSINKIKLMMNKSQINKLNMYISKLDGGKTIYSNKSCDTKINIKEAVIKDSKDKVILERNMIKLEEMEDKLSFLTFRQKDYFEKVKDLSSNWPVIELFEMNVLPLKINVTHEEIEFFLEFYFDEKSILSRKEDLSNEDDIKERICSLERTIPVYYKKMRINNLDLLLTYIYSENSKLNIIDLGIVVKAFEKKEKFYSKREMTVKFSSFVTTQIFSHLPKLISNYLFGKESCERSVEGNKELKRILLGKKGK